MVDGHRIIAIIPARGGSKGLPGKNTLSMCGKPLIAWTIEQAKASAYLDRVLVSTDDEAIATVARETGADVPFLRPAELATDAARSIDVVFHALDWVAAHEIEYQIVVLLQPTSPLRTVGDVDAAIELLSAKRASGVVSVCLTEHHPYWCNSLPSDHSMADFLRPEIANINRQALPDFYRLNGAIYAAYCDYLRVHQGFMGPATYALVMPRDRSVDIDSRLDLDFAEFLLRRAPG